MTPDYLKTKDMAQKLGYSSDFLLSNREILFFEGEHYFPKERRIDWKISKMEEWVENRNIPAQALEILDMIS